MSDIFTKRKRSQVMAAIRSKGNLETEARLAKILRFYGVNGWRRHQPLLGNPDFIFRKARLAVFVDGCFWHGCPRHGRKPGSNQEYWIEKLERNRRRDRQVSRSLRKLNWLVLRIWAHELRKPERVMRKINSLLSVSARRCKNATRPDEQQKWPFQAACVLSPIPRLAGFGPVFAQLQHNCPLIP